MFLKVFKCFLVLFLIIQFKIFAQDFSINSTSLSVCEGEMIRLSAQNCPGKVVWNNGKTGLTFTEAATKESVYSAKCVNSTTGIEISTSNTLLIKYFQKPLTPTLFCNKDEINLGQQAIITVFGCEGEVTWNNGATDKELIVKPQETTTYTAICTNQNGCESEAISRTIIIKGEITKDTPVVVWKTACFGENLTLRSSGCDNGMNVWYENVKSKDGLSSRELGRGNEFTIAESNENTYYTARCNFEKCLGNESNRLFVDFSKKLPSPIIPRKVYLDKGEVIDLNSLMPKPSINTNRFEIRTFRSQNAPIVTNISTISSAGTYFVTEVSEFGTCKSPVAKINIIESNFSIIAAQPKTLPNLEELKETPQSVSNILNQQVTSTGAVISSENENDELAYMKIPQGFSPNGDGINDVFQLQNPYNESLSLRVYNRYGHLVFQSEDYKNDWNGVANTGSDASSKIGLKDDTYFYTLNTSTGKQKISFLILQR